MFVYVLQSVKRPKKYYTGLSGNVERRLINHNDGQNTSTAKYRPWKIIAYFWFNDEAKARLFERYLKSGSGVSFSKRHLR